MARTALVRTAVLALATCAPLAVGVVTAGAASAEPPASFSEVPGYDRAALHNPHVGEPLGRKLK